MAYMKKTPVGAVARTRGGKPVYSQLGTVYSELGDFDQSTPCTDIPLNDPYRIAGNSCTCPDGSNVAVFVAGGGMVAPDGSVPACATTGTKPTAGTTAGGGTAPGAGAILSAISSIFGPKPVPGVPQTGPSTTTIALLGGAGLLVLFLATRDRE